MKKIGANAVIRIGSLLVPVDRLAESLARFTKLVFCLTDSTAHPYSLRGSATALKHKSQHLLFCCNHQIADAAPNDVVIPVDKQGQMLVSGSRFVRLSARPELAGEEMLDVCERCISIPPNRKQSLARQYLPFGDGPESR